MPFHAWKKKKKKSPLATEKHHKVSDRKNKNISSLSFDPGQDRRVVGPRGLLQTKPYTVIWVLLFSPHLLVSMLKKKDHHHGRNINPYLAAFP